MIFLDYLKKEKIHLLWILYALITVFYCPILNNLLEKKIDDVLFSSITVLLASLYGLLIVLFNKEIKKSKIRILFCIVGILLLFISLPFSWYNGEFKNIIIVGMTIINIFISFLCYLSQFIEDDYNNKMRRDIMNNIKNVNTNKSIKLNNKEIIL